MLKWLLLLLLILDVSFLALLGVRPVLFERAFSGHRTYRVEAYDGRSPVGPSRFQETAYTGPKQLDVSFEIRAQTISGHPNAFQTAPGNEGLRIELSAPATLGVVVGQADGGLKGFAVTQSFGLGVWHKVQIRSAVDGHLTVDFDGVRTVDDPNAGSDWKRSDIMIGQGFEPSRVFPGELRHFAATCQLFDGQFQRTRTLLAAALSTVGLWLAFYVVRLSGLRRPFRGYRLGETGKAVAALVLLTSCLACSWFLRDYLTSVELIPSVLGLEYDPLSHDVGVSATKEFSPNALDMTAVRVDFELKPYAHPGEQQIFQTAPGNDGLRMGLDAAGKASFLLGRQADGSLLRCGPIPLSVGKWQKVRVRTGVDGFVNVQVGGKRVFREHVAASYRIHLTKLVVGSNPDGTQPFNGAIRGFTVKYAEPYRLWLLLTVQLLLVSLLAVAAYRYRSIYVAGLTFADRLIPLRRAPPKARFAIKAAILLIPPLYFLGDIELALRKMPNNYSEKRRRFETRLADLEMLIQGSSHGFFGINPQLLAHPAFNLAYRAQSHFYDYELLRRYSNRMPRLKLAILTVTYLTFGTQQEDVEPERMYFYLKDWGIPLQWQGSVLNVGQLLDPNRFTMIHLYGDRVLGYMSNGYREGVDADLNNTGWFNAGTAPCDFSQNIGPKGAAAHNSMVHVEEFQRNAVFLQKTVDLLRKRGAETLLVQLPILPAYTQHVDQAKHAAMEKVLEEFAGKNGVLYSNFVHDSRFGQADFTDMPDHLNALGAEKFTRLLNALISSRYAALWHDGRLQTAKRAGIE